MPEGERRPPVRIGWWLSSEEHDPRQLVAYAAAAEAAGVETAMISDHLRPWVPAQGNAPFVWSVVGAIAAVTDEIEIGTGVTAMVHRSAPINVAHAGATAAVMLEGGFFLGVGTGERLNEQAFGRRWSRPGERRRQLCEAIEIVQALWRGETVNHRGPWWAVEGLQLATRPAVPPPIYVAASGKLSAAMAGQIGDGLIGVVPSAQLVDVFHGASRTGDGAAGKPCLGQLHVCLAATADEAREIAWRWWPHGVVPPAVLADLATPAEFDAIATAIGPATIADTVVCTTDVEPLVAAIDRFAGAGFDTVYLHQVGPDQRRLLAAVESELLPHYTAAER